MVKKLSTVRICKVYIYIYIYMDVYIYISLPTHTPQRYPECTKNIDMYGIGIGHLVLWSPRWTQKPREDSGISTQ